MPIFLSANGAERQPAHEMSLSKHSKGDRWHEGDDGKGRGFTILRALEADEGAEDRWQREGSSACQNQREEELGPAGNEGEDSRRDDAGRSQRHGNAPER